MPEGTPLIAIFGIMVPITFLIGTAAVLISFFNFRFREREKLHDTLRILSEKDVPQQSELIGVLTKASVPTPDRDLRRAVYMFCFAGGLIGMGLIIGYIEREAFWTFTGIALFPLSFGIGSLVLWLMGKKRAGV